MQALRETLRDRVRPQGEVQRGGFVHRQEQEHHARSSTKCVDEPGLPDLQALRAREQRQTRHFGEEEEHQLAVLAAGSDAWMLHS